MEEKKCQYCKEEISGKRDDAKFCSNTCKAKHWEEKKLSISGKEEKNIASQLRGVLIGPDNVNAVPEETILPEQIFKTAEQPFVNLARLFLDNQFRRLTDVRKQTDKEVYELQAKLNQITSLNGNGWIVGLTGAGALVGNKSAKEKTEGTILGGTFGFITGMIIHDATKNSREEDKKRQVNKLQKEIQSRTTFIQDTDKELKILDEQIKTTPRYRPIQ